MTAAVQLPGSVLPAELQATFWVDKVTHIVHTHSAGQMTDCWVPLMECAHKVRADSWQFHLWCQECFPGRRCRRRIVATFNRRAGRCGQPSEPGTECRMHIAEDNTIDKAMERAA